MEVVETKVCLGLQNVQSSCHMGRRHTDAIVVMQGREALEAFWKEVDSHYAIPSLNDGQGSHVALSKLHLKSKSELTNTNYRVTILDMVLASYVALLLYDVLQESS